MSKYYVTTPIYYANAAPHIGSAYPTLAADVLARYHGRQGDDTFFLTGTAEHGQKIARAAEAAGLDPQAFTDTTSEYFKNAWDALNIQPSDFIRTTQPRHKQAVVAFFEKLKDSGHIYEGEYTGLYCVGHEAFLKESELTPDGLCPDHQTRPEEVTETNWFFKLSKYEDQLLKLIEGGQLTINPRSRHNEVVSFIKQGLEDIAISRQNVSWAIPLPWDESQTIYVWLDELFNYCSAIGYHTDDVILSEAEGSTPTKKFDYYWPANVHIVGKDIIKFHCIIWPALLLAIGEQPPQQVFAHGFFTIDGQKISKSLGNVIDPIELVQTYGADAVRYYLLRDIPFGSDGDFSLSRLEARYQADLANGLGNLVSRTLTMIEKYWPDFTPAPTPDPELTAQVEKNLDNLAFSEALENIWKRVQDTDQLIEDKKPWQLSKEGKQSEIEDTLNTAFHNLVVINQALAPFLPDTHSTLTALLTASPIKKPKHPLFPRLEKSEILPT